MITRITDILRVVNENKSLSEARRFCFIGQIKINGEKVNWIADEVEIETGTTFEYGRRKWTWNGSQWEN